MTIALLALEVPLAGLLAFAAPFAGIPIGFFFAGAEVVVLPVVFAMLVLPSIAAGQRR